MTVYGRATFITKFYCAHCVVTNSPAERASGRRDSGERSVRRASAKRTNRATRAAKVFFYRFVFRLCLYPSDLLRCLPPRQDVWLDMCAENVLLPPGSIPNPDCVGHLMKLGHRAKEWQRRFCVLKDACLYFYVDINVSSALGNVTLASRKKQVCFKLV